MRADDAPSSDVKMNPWRLEVRTTRFLKNITFAFAFSGFLSALPAHPAPAAALSCHPIPGTESLLQSGKILLFGEVHGTAEGPAFIADIACLAVQKDVKLTLALEIPSSEKARVEKYLASKGLPQDRAELLAGPFWSSGMQDGRSSEAMFQLLESLRKLQLAKKSFQFELFDALDASSSQDRDRAMASNLEAAIQRAPGDLFVVLTGNIHSRTVQGVPWDEKLEPLGLLLTRKLSDRVVPLNIASSGGTAWMCLAPSDCKAQPVQGSMEGDAPRIVLRKERDKGGHAANFFVGKLTASPPAVGQKPESPK